MLAVQIKVDPQDPGFRDSNHWLGLHDFNVYRKDFLARDKIYDKLPILRCSKGPSPDMLSPAFLKDCTSQLSIESTILDSISPPFASILVDE